MKKILVIALVGLAFITSCSKEENFSSEKKDSNVTVVSKSVSGITISDKLDENLNNYFGSLLSEQKLIIGELSESENVLDESFIDAIDSVKSEEDLRQLLNENGITNSENIILSFNNIELIKENFINNNKEFYELLESDRNLIFEQYLDENLDSVYGKVDAGSGSGGPSCAGQYNTSIRRAQRNFAICGSGAVLAAGFTGGVGGLIGGGVCMATYYFAIQDAREDYANCINN